MRDFRVCVVLCIVVATACLCFGFVTRETGSESAAMSENVLEEILITNQKQIWEALKTKDTNSFSGLVADDALIVSENGGMTKPQFVQLIPRLDDITGYSMKDVKVVSINKDVAIMTHTTTYRTMEPDLQSYTVYETTVWARRGAKWLAVFNQETPTK